MANNFYPEGNAAIASDNAERSLKKINDILYSGGGTISSGNPVVQTARADTTALAANANRKKAFIQNNGTSVMFVKEGDGCSASSFSASIAGGAANDNGYGGTYNVLTTSKITVFSSGTLRYSVTEVS